VIKTTLAARGFGRAERRIGRVVASLSRRRRGRGREVVDVAERGLVVEDGVHGRVRVVLGAAGGFGARVGVRGVGRRAVRIVLRVGVRGIRGHAFRVAWG
jgi:hypothetical protein